MVDTKINFLLLVVLYNKTLHTSETLGSLLTFRDQLKGSKLLLWDNSPASALTKDELEVLQSSFTEVEYVCTPENLALSAIYNQVLQRQEMAKYEGLVLLDHDSLLADNFFTEARSSMAQHPDINLFLPIVESNNEIVSPADLYLFKGVRWKQKQTGLTKAKRRAAINSGMVIRTGYVQNEYKGYDERLKFYGTDTYFMNCYATQNKYFYVLNTSIQHQLNYFEKEELDVKLRRFREIRRSTAILNEQSIWTKALTEVYLLAFSALQAVRFKSTRFLYDHKR